MDFENSKERAVCFFAGAGLCRWWNTVAVNGRDTFHRAIEDFEHKIEHYDIPSDGLVLTYDEYQHTDSPWAGLQSFPRDSIAFKWADEIAGDYASKRSSGAPAGPGLINPVAVFEPVELEGTTVSTAPVSTTSASWKRWSLGSGDRITVYKANMIIPQIADNLTSSGVRDIPKICPVCGGQDGDPPAERCKIPILYEPGLSRQRRSRALHLFVSRDALNIDGLSEMTLEKFIDGGIYP